MSSRQNVNKKVVITENFCRDFWRNNWRSIFDVVERLCNKNQPTLMRHPKTNNFNKLRSAVEHYLRDIHKRLRRSKTGWNLLSNRFKSCRDKRDGGGCESKHCKHFGDVFYGQYLINWTRYWYLYTILGLTQIFVVAYKFVKHPSF